MKMVDECTFKKRLGLPTFTSQSTNLGAVWFSGYPLDGKGYPLFQWLSSVWFRGSGG
jgi:hypothetical protein